MPRPSHLNPYNPKQIINQRQLAIALNIPYTTVNSWFIGTRKPKPKNKEKLIGMLGTSDILDILQHYKK